MKKLVAILSLLVLTGCAGANPYATRGATIGGAVGAVAGGVTTGTPQGALVGGAIGAASGAVIGAAATPGHCRYRDRRGREYVDVCR